MSFQLKVIFEVTVFLHQENPHLFFFFKEGFMTGFLLLAKSTSSSGVAV